MANTAKKYNYMTVPAAIKELEKIEMVRGLDRIYRMDHAVTKTQKTILSSFGLDEATVRRSAEEIGRLLEDSQSLMNEEEPTDGEEEIIGID